MAFATIDVTKGITGSVPTANLPTIPVTKGGTGLTAGTTGQFLKFTGSTAIGSAESSTTWTKISKTTVSSSSTVGTLEITGIAGYKRYWIAGNSITVTAASGNNHLKWQFGTSSSYYTSSSNAQEFFISANNDENLDYQDSGSENHQTSNASFMQKNVLAESGSGNEVNGCRLNFNLYFGAVNLTGNNPDTGGGLKSAWGEAMWNRNGDTHHYARHVGGYLEYNQAIDRIRFLFHSGNSINSGQFILYGLTDSA